jgi:membrane-bound lytic murein transglycosylase D
MPTHSIGMLYKKCRSWLHKNFFMSNIQGMKITAKRLLAYLAIGLLCGCQAPAGKDTANEAEDFYTNNFSANSDIWSAMRPNFQLLTAENQRNSQAALNWYLQHRSLLNKALNQSRPYIYYIYHATRQRNMPAEVALIPAVESGYNPFLYSKDGAVGLWQLMPGTASGLGIKIDWWYDGRRNVVDSTNASLTYIGYLKSYSHSDWLKTFASYDAGAGTIQHAEKLQRSELGYNDYWSLNLPLETKRYVPSIIALAMIIKDPQKYNVTLPDVPDQPFFASVKCKEVYSIRQMAKLAHVSTNEVRILNAGYRRNDAPNDQNYSILLPIANIQTFAQNTALLHNVKSSSDVRHYIVKDGDTLSGISHKYHVAEKLVKKANGLKNNILHAKQSIVIPGSEVATTPYASTHVDEAIAEDHIPGPVRVIYKVKDGDSLKGIAQQYDLSTKAISYWNNLALHTNLSNGQELTLWLSPSEYAQTRFYSYKVKPGDSLIRIAHKYHVDGLTIKHANKLKTDNLRVGQNLLIPAQAHWVHIGKSSQAHEHVHANSHVHVHAHTAKHRVVAKKHTKHYMVEEGDSLFSIAKKFHTNSKAIALANNINLKHPLLHSGKKLIIPSSPNNA